MNISTDAARLREQARHKDGKFGHYQLDSSTVDLDDMDWAAGAGEAPERPHIALGKDYVPHGTSPKGARTPWGPADHVHIINDGIAFYDCPGHGGFKLSPANNRQVPQPLRRSDGWYEEDVDANIVFATFAYHMRDPGGWKYLDKDPVEIQGDAEKNLRNHFPDEWEHVTGEKVTAEESFVIRQREWVERNKTAWVNQAASLNSKVSEERGEKYLTVYVQKRDTKEKTCILMSAKDYDAQQKHGDSNLGQFPVNMEGAEIDEEALEEELRYSAKRKALQEKYRTLATTAPWGDELDSLTPGERERAERFLDKLVRGKDGTVSTWREYMENTKFHAVSESNMLLIHKEDSTGPIGAGYKIPASLAKAIRRNFAKRMKKFGLSDDDD